MGTKMLREVLYSISETCLPILLFSPKPWSGLLMLNKRTIVTGEEYSTMFFELLWDSLNLKSHFSAQLPFLECKLSQPLTSLPVSLDKACWQSCWIQSFKVLFCVLYVYHASINIGAWQRGRLKTCVVVCSLDISRPRRMSSTWGSMLLVAFTRSSLAHSRRYSTIQRRKIYIYAHSYLRCPRNTRLIYCIESITHFAWQMTRRTIHSWR